MDWKSYCSLMLATFRAAPSNSLCLCPNASRVAAKSASICWVGLCSSIFTSVYFLRPLSYSPSYFLGRLPQCFLQRRVKFTSQMLLVNYFFRSQHRLSSKVAIICFRSVKKHRSPPVCYQSKRLSCWLLQSFLGSTLRVPPAHMLDKSNIPVRTIRSAPQAAFAKTSWSATPLPWSIHSPPQHR